MPLIPVWGQREPLEVSNEVYAWAGGFTWRLDPTTGQIWRAYANPIDNKVYKLTLSDETAARAEAEKKYETMQKEKADG
jgi:hypothetical protein